MLVICDGMAHVMRGQAAPTHTSMYPKMDDRNPFESMVRWCLRRRLRMYSISPCSRGFQEDSFAQGRTQCQPRERMLVAECTGGDTWRVDG